MKEIHELDVYKLSENLSDLIWYGFDKWSVKAQNTIGYQIIRSSDSIAANLAEGYGRYTPADRKKFAFMHGALLRRPKLGCASSFAEKS